MLHRSTVYGNEPTFGGGWPLLFLIDRPGVSVTGKLTLLEDAAFPLAFLLDTLFWTACAWLVVAVRRMAGSR
jgi:hypothetical protein